MEVLRILSFIQKRTAENVLTIQTRRAIGAHIINTYQFIDEVIMFVTARTKFGLKGTQV